MLQANVAALGKRGVQLALFGRKSFFVGGFPRLCSFYHTESPSSEPGYLMVEDHEKGEFGFKKGPFALSSASVASLRHFAKLQVQNQEEPLLRSYLMLKHTSTTAKVGSFAQVVFSLAGNVLKHRKRKMNKHKFKKRLRLQRKKAPKNQLIKYVKYSKR